MAGIEQGNVSEPTEVIPAAASGYYVMNNDRVVQLASGRLVAPLAQHYGMGQPTWTGAAVILCYLSDDGGRTWTRGQAAPLGDRVLGEGGDDDDLELPDGP